MIDLEEKVKNLGIIGVDFGLHKDTTKIIIISKLHGGRIEIIATRKFNSIYELEKEIKELKKRYSIEDFIADTPPNFNFFGL